MLPLHSPRACKLSGHATRGAGAPLEKHTKITPPGLEPAVPAPRRRAAERRGGVGGGLFEQGPELHEGPLYREAQDEARRQAQGEEADVEEVRVAVVRDGRREAAKTLVAEAARGEAVVVAAALAGAREDGVEPDDLAEVGRVGQRRQREEDGQREDAGRDADRRRRRGAVRRVPVWKSTTGLGRPDQTSKFSISIKSKSIWLIFGRIDCSHRVLEAQLKSLAQSVLLCSH